MAKKNEADHACLIEALTKLAPSVVKSQDVAWEREPALRVIDCVLSLNRDYDHFVVPRLDRFEQKHPRICSVQDLKIEIEKYPTCHEFVVDALDYRHEARAITLGAVVIWLSALGGDGSPAVQLKTLEAWAKKAHYDDFKQLGIRGFGLAGFQYMRMLFGADTSKPDIQICKWVGGAVGHRVSPETALRLLERAGPEVGLSLRDVDTTIWNLLAREKTAPPLPEKSAN